MRKLIFKGVATALITPFNENKSIDFVSFGKIIDSQLESGVNALVVCGTTGEASTLNYEERKALIKYAKNKVKGKVPIIAGAGSNNFEVSKKLMSDAVESGADACLMVTPYYNKTTQKGLIEIFKAYSEISPVPVMAYNVPSRTGVAFTSDTYQEIEKFENIVAVKEADGDVNKFAETRAKCNDMVFYSGNDSCIIPFMSLGAQGVISVLSNVFPTQTVETCQKFFDNDIINASRMQIELTPLIKAMFSAVNPIPVKYVAYKMGLCKNELRLPLVPLDKENCKKLYEETKNEDIDILINNAGFGVHGKFCDTDLNKEVQMIETNITAVHILMKLYLKDMIKKDRGHILNVASMAAFGPGPLMISYYASKAYVYRLSQGVKTELRKNNSKVKISVLCPGPVRTNFNKVAGVDFAAPSLSSEYVAKYAVKNFQKGKFNIVPGFMIKCAKFMSKITPDFIVAKICYYMQEKKK